MYNYVGSASSARKSASPLRNSGRIYTPRTALGYGSRRSPSRSLGRAVSQPMTGHHDKVFPYTRKVWDPTEVDRYDSLIRQELRKEDDLLGMMDLDEHRRRAREETRNLSYALRHAAQETDFLFANQSSPHKTAEAASEALSELEPAKVVTDTKDKNKEDEWVAAARAIEGAVYVGHKVGPLSDGRTVRYVKIYPELGQAVETATLVVQVPEGSSGEDYVEYVAYKTKADGAVNTIIVEDKVMLSDVSITQLIEYKFDEDPADLWRVGNVTLETYEMTLAMKFDAWKKTFLGADCEAALRRMLRNGIPRSVCDHGMFPTPEEHKSIYTVVDEKTGKDVLIPHPITAARIWNPSNQNYTPITVEMKGVPVDDAQRAALWNQLVEEIKVKFGAEIVDKIIEEQK